MCGYFSGSVTLISTSLIFKYWSTECNVPQILEKMLYKNLEVNKRAILSLTSDHFLTQQRHPFQQVIWKMSRITVNRKHIKI